MPVISFISPKGGVGKTTSLMTVASILIQKKQTVHIIDADENYPFLDWKNETQKRVGGLTISANEKEESLIEDITKAKNGSDFVLVDVEGTANMRAVYAAISSDHVIVPCQRSKLDAKLASKAIISVLKAGKEYGISIPTSLLLTRTSPAIRTKSLKAMKASLVKNHIDVFEVELFQREAFKAMFDYSALLQDLPKSVSGKDKALENAQALTYELMRKMGLIKERNAA